MVIFERHCFFHRVDNEREFFSRFGADTRRELRGVRRIKTWACLPRLQRAQDVAGNFNSGFRLQTSRETANEPYAFDGTFRGWWIILLRSIQRDCFWNQWRYPSRTTASRTLRASAFMSVYQRSDVFHQRSSVSISGSKTALRAVGPLFPPALSPPAKALVEKGGQAGGGVRR